MDGCGANKKEQKKGRRFSQQQYEMLKRCSDNEDMTEWNKWRQEHPEEDVLLEGVDLSGWYLKGVILGINQLTDWNGRVLHGETHLENAILEEADLEGADLQFAELQNANLMWCNLKDAGLMNANLRGARLWFARLEKAGVAYALLGDAEFRRATVDGSTSLWKCKVNQETNFLGVSLDVAKIDPGTKQLLEYNIRRKNWEDWYKGHAKLKWLVKPFWWMSNYGLSTGRIIATFFGLAFVFANTYYHWGRIAPPGIVENLFIDHNGIAIQWWLVPLRTLYFSIVTQTTLGFGDMYANAHSIFGHILLSIQVILGYVLLGALVTRFAVLFTAGGPAGRFADEKKKATEE